MSNIGDSRRSSFAAEALSPLSNISAPACFIHTDTRALIL